MLKTFVQPITDTTSYFKKIREYEAWIKSVKSKDDFSLRLDDVLLFKKKMKDYFDYFENYKQIAAYTVTNHQLQKERLKASEWLTELDNETKEMLANDAAINTCYQLLLKLIQN